MLYYPKTTDQASEVKFWLYLQAHEPSTNLGGAETIAQDDDVFGDPVGVPIYLQAPQQMVLGDSHNYNQINLKTLLGGADMLDNITDAKFAEAFGDAWSAIKTLSGDLPVIGDIITNVNYLNQETVNPREEVVFSKPNFRTMNFSWELGISETEDYEELDKIVKTIRKNSYPSIADSFMYKMPYQWSVKLVAQGNDQVGPNIKWWSFGKCVLESMTTNFTGAGMVVSSVTNNPQFVNLELAFKEVKLRHQSSAVLSND